MHLRPFALLSLLMLASCALGGAKLSGAHAMKFHVAPLQCYTNRHLRAFLRFLSHDAVLWTEMEKAEDLASLSQQALARRLRHIDDVGGGTSVLQLGGSHMGTLLVASRHARTFRYSELNLNVGCPSIETGGASYGAALMRDAAHTHTLAATMAEAFGAPVSIKCRLAAHDAVLADGKVPITHYETLAAFAETVTADGAVDHLIVHARAAVLGGLSPSKNRCVPPLLPEYVHRLAAEFPDVRITLNGGLGWGESERILQRARQAGSRQPGAIDGIMCGRAVLRSPLRLVGIDAANGLTPFDIEALGARCIDAVRRYQAYAVRTLAATDEDVPSITVPLLLLLEELREAAAEGAEGMVADESDALGETHFETHLEKRAHWSLPETTLVCVFIAVWEATVAILEATGRGGKGARSSRATAPNEGAALDALPFRQLANLIAQATGKQVANKVVRNRKEDIGSAAAAAVPKGTAGLGRRDGRRVSTLVAMQVRSRGRRVTMQVGMSGGDLEDGRDAARNAQVQALKKLLYQPSAPKSAEAAVADVGRHAGDDEGAAAAGLLRNVPLARFQMVLLPHQQAAFNIFQPQLLHCFETLLATAPPWRYVHVLLPGGADNLANPAYALPGLADGSFVEDGAEEGGEGKGDEGGGGAPGPLATLSGTLMEIVWWSRLPDATLSLVCQGLSRAVVLRGTQDIPYARADVLLLPDAEQIAAAARSLPGKQARPWTGASSVRGIRGIRWIGAPIGPVGAPIGPVGAPIGPAAKDIVQQSRSETGAASGSADRAGASAALVAAHGAVLARAIAEDVCWRPFEFAPVTAPVRLDRLVPGLAAFASFAPAAAAAAAACASAAALTETEAGTATGAATTALAADAARGGVQWRLVRAVLAQGDELAAAEPTEADDAEALALVEDELWIELDAFLRALAMQRGGSLPAPAQILALLPPSPRAWPADFVLSRVAEALREKTEAFGVDLTEPFVPCDSKLYTARRRQQRLSFCVWAVISQDSGQLLRALEAFSTRERLQLASQRLRVLRQELEGSSAAD